VLSKVAPRKLKRLHDSRESIYDKLRAQYFKHGTVAKIARRTDVSRKSALKPSPRHLARRSIAAESQK